MAKLATTIEWKWFNKDDYTQTDPHGWVVLSKNESAVLEKEYQASLAGTRTKRIVYNCFGTRKKNASVSFSKMETMCAGICCGFLHENEVPKEHMVYKIKRTKLVFTDLAGILEDMQRKEKKKKLCILFGIGIAVLSER